MNNSIIVSTAYNCDLNFHDIRQRITNPTWRHNMIGCYLVQILQNMYNLSVTYVPQTLNNSLNNTIDLYANPMLLSPEILNVAKPLHTVLTWRFGFILTRPHDYGLYLQYYSKPLSRTVWICLYGILIFIVMIFYVLSRYERKHYRTKWECSLSIEMLVAFGGYCQHVLPFQTIANSRRTAYFTFFLYCYVIYTFYTSNLLSHLVSDNYSDVHLGFLASNDYDVAILDTMTDVFDNEYKYYIYDKNMTSISQKLRTARALSLKNALHEVRYKKTALLSDYISVYPLLKRTFSDSEICQLTKIDVSSEVRKYFFSSKHFRYREQLVIGTLKAKEAGVIQRLTHFDSYKPLYCYRGVHHEVDITQIYRPLLMLFTSYAFALFILLIEIRQRNRNVFPYRD